MKKDFAGLYDRCFDEIYRYVYFRTNNKWETDDIFSSVFQKAYEKYDTVNDNPRAWLFAIAKNLLTDYYRRKKFVSLDDSMEELPSTEDLERGLENKDLLKRLKISLKELSEEEQEIIKLKYFTNMKFREIALFMGKEESTVKTKSRRAIKKLRNLLDRKLEG